MRVLTANYEESVMQLNTLAAGSRPGDGTIIDDDPLPSVGVTDVTVTEDHAGTVDAVFTSRRSAAARYR